MEQIKARRSQGRPIYKRARAQISGRAKVRLVAQSPGNGGKENVVPTEGEQRGDMKINHNIREKELKAIL
jgi:hypothetical protein